MEHQNGEPDFTSDSTDIPEDEVNEVIDTIIRDFLNSFVGVDVKYNFNFKQMDIVYKPNDQINELIPNHILLYYDIDFDKNDKLAETNLNTLIDQKYVKKIKEYTCTVKIIFPIKNEKSNTIKMFEEEIKSSYFKNANNNFCIPANFFNGRNLNMKSFDPNNTTDSVFQSIIHNGNYIDQNKEEYNENRLGLDSLVLEFYPNNNFLNLKKKTYKTTDDNLTSYYMFNKKKYLGIRSTNLYAINDKEVTEAEFKKLPNWIPQDLLDEKGNLKIQPLSTSAVFPTGGSNKHKNSHTKKRRRGQRSNNRKSGYTNRKGCKHGILFRP